MRDGQRREIIVVGGGISGLATAWTLHRAGADVALLEAGEIVGGCMRSEHRDGFILEKGPFNVLVRDEAFRRMLDECGDAVTARTASVDANKRYLLKNGALHEVPMGPPGLVRTPLLSGRAKLRLLRGMLLSRRAPNEDPTIAETAERRLGPEVADTFISSIVAGVFGGDSRTLSLHACFPKAWRFDQDRRSPLLYELGVLRQKKREAKERGGPPPYKGLINFEGGLQALADHLARELGAGLRTECRLESIERDDDGYRLRATTPDGSEAFRCSRLVLAAPAAETSRLIQPFAPGAAEEIEGVRSSSLVVLNLGYRSADVRHPMSGYGFLVPASETECPVMGVLWADSAFPHHAPADRRVIRVFMGGPRDPEATGRTGEELLRIATGAVGDLLGITGDPALVDVCRWPGSIPQYERGHIARLDRLDAALYDVPDLHLVGNYLRGVSINDCVRQGVEMAETILARNGDAPGAIPVVRTGATTPGRIEPPARHARDAQPAGS